jgi:hypothetical protein
MSNSTDAAKKPTTTTTEAKKQPTEGAKKSAPTMNIFQRMLAATSEINRVAKNLKVDISKSQSYKAVAESDVLEAVKPIEEKYGIYSYPVSRTIIKDETYTTQSTYDGRTSEKNTFFLRVETVYRFVNTDKPEEYIDITTYGDGVDTQDKAPGKAMTYGDKYALLKAYKIQTGDDPDANPSGNLGKKKVEKPTPEQLKKAQELGIDLNNLAAYAKCAVEEISKDILADAIEMKQKALAKKQAAENGKGEQS